MKGRILLFFFVLCGLMAVAQANIADTQGHISAELLGNLANNYADHGQVGLAVLNYERALLLAPGDADLRATLMELRKKEGLLRERSLHRRLADLLGADQWLLLSGVAFAFLALTVLTVGLLGRQRFLQACRLSVFFLAATLLPLPLAWLRYQAWQNGVVTAAQVKLLISPFAGAETVAHLKAGSLVRPLHKEYNRYTLIRDEDGHSGWLEQSSFQRIY